MKVLRGHAARGRGAAITMDDKPLTRDCSSCGAKKGVECLGPGRGYCFMRFVVTRVES